MEKVNKPKSRDPETGLTYNEKAFVEEFVRNGYNATQAYITVYQAAYNTANSRAHQIMAKPKAKAYVKVLQKEAFEQACISAERVALKLAEIAFSGKEDEVYNATAQLKALDLIQKQLGIQNQKITADVNNELTISVGVKKPEEDKGE